MCSSLAQYVIELLESLNRSLQSTKATVAEMLDCAKSIKLQLQKMRTDKEFDEILGDVESKIKLLDVDELSVPRTRKPPARFCGLLAEAFQTNSVRTYYRMNILS